MSKLEIIYASSSSLIGLGAKKNNLRKGIAEVAGSNPTQSTFYRCTNYGIELSSFSVIVG